MYSYLRGILLEKVYSLAKVTLYLKKEKEVKYIQC